MAIKSFRDLTTWQESRKLTIGIYRAFQDVRDYSFKDQIQRATVSVMNNIAEGYAKRSDKGLRNYLYIALGSATEVQSMLDAACELQYISLEDRLELRLQAEKTSRHINAFIGSLSSSANYQQPLANHE